MKNIFLLFILMFSVGAYAKDAGIHDADTLVSAYSHGQAHVIRLMPGPQGLVEIVYRENGKTLYGWMTDDGQGFIPATTCVVDFYGPGVGDDLCDTVSYFHGHWRHVYEHASRTYAATVAARH